MARPIYYTNTGVIPDEVAAKVMTTDGRVIGTVSYTHLTLPTKA